MLESMKAILAMPTKGKKPSAEGEAGATVKVSKPTEEAQGVEAADDEAGTDDLDGDSDDSFFEEETAMSGDEDSDDIWVLIGLSCTLSHAL
eukprot:m.159234 g.159234  ORF g.159234 m.159234 type:complete len:91 (+) comp14340_c0_seq40:535-807(+)